MTFIKLYLREFMIRRLIKDSFHRIFQVKFIHTWIRVVDSNVLEWEVLPLEKDSSLECTD